MKKIDVFTHIWPEAYFKALIGIVGEMHAITARSGRVPMMTNLDRRFEVMDMFGDDYCQILSLAAPPLEAICTPDQALELSRIGTDSMAELCAKYPRRFPGFIGSAVMNNPDAVVDEARRNSERARLDALAGLVETAECRRAVLLRHFGEFPPASCGNCDNCLEQPGVTDVTELARKLLSAVYRTGQSFGMGHVQKVLTGNEDERVRQRGHDRLSVFGIVEGDEARLLQPLSRALQARENCSILNDFSL